MSLTAFTRLKHRVSYLASTLLIGSTTIYLGCSSGSAPTANDTAANSNAVANTMTNATSNSTSNSIARTGNVHLPDSAISAETLIGALKTRLSHDNPTAMPQADDRSDLWLDSSVGSFYKNDDEITKLMVCDITEKTLGEFDKKLKPFAKQKLHDAVSAHTSCREAVNLMFKATLNSTPINPVP